MAAARLTAAISTKGRVILPKVIREQLQWRAGMQLVVENTAQGVLLKPVTQGFPAARAQDVSGCLSYSGKPKTLEDMEAGMAAEANRRRAGG